jgi:hypothetical protein
MVYLQHQGGQGQHCPDYAIPSTEMVETLRIHDMPWNIAVWAWCVEGEQLVLCR